MSVIQIISFENVCGSKGAWDTSNIIFIISCPFYILISALENSNKKKIHKTFLGTNGRTKNQLLNSLMTNIQEALKSSK